MTAFHKIYRLVLAGLLLVTVTITAAVAQRPQTQPSAITNDSAPPDEDMPTGSDVPPPKKATASDTPIPAPPKPYQVTGVVLRGLDKVTARISTIDVPINGTAQFGTLVIKVRTCKLSPPDAPPDATAFLEITDVAPDQPAKLVFSGWMFASSPALSALQHPVYDVWVKTCMTATPSKP